MACAALAACSEPPGAAPGEVSAGEKRALEEAAEMLGERRFPEQAAPESGQLASDEPTARQSSELTGDSAE
ncbi:hypothetical protein [Erythrobacter ani]|uniref:Lipoprotein n=1 Tax=Erythrobacter ani TaxID=2827235 RepID=A0ABS6SK04_9SPHN|nr:hypothetical protein [Erythrobacter ani]MBV7265355.1 hypothetical protein [Erythrobacter ani]